jgi:two-component system LytT family response regulator
MKIKTLLVDDEQKSLASLAKKIRNHLPLLDIIAEIQDPEDAIEAIDQFNPQLVFIDIAMPNLSGFDVLAQVKNPDFEIIFVTAFDQYAVQAIKHAAIGYLLKPLDDEDLQLAVKNALANIELKNAAVKNHTLLENLSIQDNQTRKLAIPAQNELHLSKMEDIVHCEGSEGYTRFHFKNNSNILSSHSIGYYAKTLTSSGFFQIHRSHLINLQLVEKYYNDGHVKMENGNTLPVSRNKRSELLELFKIQV